MARRGENIHKRKDGRWEGRYKNGINVHGKTKYKSVYGKTYREVKEKLLVAKQNSAFAVSAEQDKTFGEIINIWFSMKQNELKGSTIQKYSYLIEKHILPELGSIKMSKINSFLLRGYINNKLQNGGLQENSGLSAAYVRSMALIIDSVLKFATEEEFSSPFTGKVFKPAITKKELHILPITQQHKLETHLLISQTSISMGILLALWTGLRIGEICALSWDDIDFNRRVLHVGNTVTRVPSTSKNQKTMLILDKPKTQSSIRDIPITNALLKILQDWKTKSKSPYVVSDKSSFISPRTFEYRFHQFLKNVGLYDFNFHVLRHTFATRCVEIGIDTKTLSEILGHSSVSTTLNIYVHPSMELKRQQMDKFANCIYGQKIRQLSN